MSSGLLRGSKSIVNVAGFIIPLVQSPINAGMRE